MKAHSDDTAPAIVLQRFAPERDPLMCTPVRPDTMTLPLRACLLLLLGALLLVGCAVGPSSSTTAASPSTVPAASPVFVPQVQALEASPVPVTTTVRPEPTTSVPVFGYTHQRPDGNRYARGRGAILVTTPIDVALDGVPSWVVATAEGNDSVWAVVLEDGNVQAFRLEGDQAREIEINPSRLPAGMPPLLKLQDGNPTLVTVPSDDVSPQTHPVVLPRSGRLIYVATNGDLVLWDDGEVARLTLNALPDARLLVDDVDRVLLLTDATKRYTHGVLGDRIEAGSISLVQTRPDLRIERRIVIPEPSVVEGIAPIWADITGNGEREIIVTLSDADQGARVTVYAETGQQLASGPAIGSGFRWRHQLAVAPLGPAGELELVDVLTPHIGGVVEFYRLTGDRLEVVAKIKGYTSHVIGSRNLDMGVAGDFDGDGQPEVLVFNLDRTALISVRHVASGFKDVRSVYAGGRVSTNIATVGLADGRLVVGVGQEDGPALRIWLPQPQVEGEAEDCLCDRSSFGDQEALR